MLELGGGTGEDAVWLAQQGFQPTLTDASPAMVAHARAKLAAFGARAEVTAAEDLGAFADRHCADGSPSFDAAFSNFAALNCLDDLEPQRRAHARLVRPGGTAFLVLFGIASPGEILTETLRGRPTQAFRRFQRGAVAARLGGQSFTVRYHRSAMVKAAMRPWFRLQRRYGIGIFVPPSAAEPWISRHPGLLRLCEKLDLLAAGPFALLGDHILYRFERTDATVS